MALAISILAMVLATLSHLMLLGLCLFGMANTTREQMRQIQLWMLLVGVVAVAMIAVGVLLLRSGHPWWNAGASIAVAVAMWVVLVKGTTP